MQINELIKWCGDGTTLLVESKKDPECLILIVKNESEKPRLHPNSKKTKITTRAENVQVSVKINKEATGV